MTFKNKHLFHKENGQKGGRPKQNSEICINIPDIKFVMLTQDQYDKLYKHYGDTILQKAVSILDKWFMSGSPIAEKYLGKNNYAHFRSDGWVINEAMKMCNITKN